MISRKISPIGRHSLPYVVTDQGKSLTCVPSVTIFQERSCLQAVDAFTAYDLHQRQDFSVKARALDALDSSHPSKQEVNIYLGRCFLLLQMISMCNSSLSLQVFLFP